MNQPKCSFCNGTHHNRNCNIEPTLAPLFKQEVGIYMEEHITNNINCPRCNGKKLYKLGDHTPSIDIVCIDCKQMYEVKSKCLSVKNLPNDIFCNSGHYYEFINNIKNKKLDIIIVLYGANREKKEISIREILYVPNDMIYNVNNKNHNVIISKKNDNQLSCIEIKYKDKLNKIEIKNKTLSFKDLYKDLLQKFVSS